jgi:hypothetical protein
MFQSLYRELANQNRFDRAHAGTGQNTDDDRHAPTWRTGLAKMVVDATRTIRDGVPVHGAVSMDVRHDTRRVAPIWETARSITKVRATLGIHPICRRLDVGCLQGKLEHRGNHHDDDAPMKPRLGANAQLHTFRLPRGDDFTPTGTGSATLFLVYPRGFN